VTAYYNEIDEHAAGWLENLIAEGHIARGIVDRRSIADIAPGDLDGFTQCHFFAGIGGWSVALRLAGWPDTRPVWTGSCPCQPFSLAGAQRGFADERHLWPVWRALIAERRPAKVFGEQVASATAWLGLVRGDLEALGYAVGAIPMEAASAGADHLRDRYWFVADTDYARSQGRIVLSERAGERASGPDGVADANEPGAREGRQQRGGEFGGVSGDPEACDCELAYACGEEHQRERLSPRSHGSASPDAERRDGSSELSWVIGADGKARRVKSGIRLLAHGVPNRVGLLRGFGNAIDPRPASEFIRACGG